MEKDSGVAIPELRVDGGASANNFLMQFQSDILGIPVVRPKVTETTARGAAFLAGLEAGVWSSKDEMERIWERDKKFIPKMDKLVRDEKYRLWKKAVSRSANWIDA